MYLYFASSMSARSWTTSEKQFILDILNDSRSWHTKSSWVPTTRKERANWSISLEKQEYIDRETNEEKVFGLSVTFMLRQPRETWFSYENWSMIPMPLQGVYSLKHYRTYVVNHEAGHALGLPHPTKKQLDAYLKNTRHVPVMIQQTLGISNYLPNTWPLPEELYLLKNYSF